MSLNSEMNKNIKFTVTPAADYDETLDVDATNQESILMHQKYKAVSFGEWKHMGCYPVGNEQDHFLWMIRSEIDGIPSALVQVSNSNGSVYPDYIKDESGAIPPDRAMMWCQIEYR